MQIRKCFMQKKLIRVIAPLALGIITGAVHLFEMQTVFADGVLQNETPLTAVTISLTALSLAAFALLALRERGGVEAGVDYSHKYPSQLGFLIIDLALGLSFVSVGVWIILFGGKDLTDFITVALCALTGLSVALMGYSGKRGKDAILTMSASLLPGVLFAFLMAVIYHDYAGSPSVLRYCWAVSAFGLTALSFMAFAGYAFDRGSRRQSTFFPMSAAFALCVLLFEGGEAWRMAVACSALIFTELSLWKEAEKTF